MRKACFLLIAAALLAGAFCAAEAEVASGTAGESITWSLSENGTLTFTGEGAMADYGMQYAPSQMMTLTTAPWMPYTPSIKAVNIGSGITDIGMCAFGGMPYITQVTFPEGLLSVRAYAFSGCYMIADVRLPDSVTQIGDEAFRDLSNITSFHFPDALVSLGRGAFMNCRKLTSVDLPEGFETMGGACFKSCVGLTHVSVPSTTTAIGYDAFSGCAESIGYGGSASVFCFENGTVTVSGTGNVTLKPNWSRLKTPLVRAVFMPGITGIGEKYFENCASLREVTIPDSVTSIGNNAFAFCSALPEVALPAGLTSLGDAAFLECGSLRQIDLPEGITRIGRFTLAGCTSLTELRIPAGVRAVDDYAFNGTNGVEEILLPDACTEIGSYAFMGCTALRRVRIPEGVQIIRHGVFADCPNLKEIRLPKTVTRMWGERICANCTGLTDLYVPELGLSDLSSLVFDGMPATVRIHALSFSQTAARAIADGLTLVPLDSPENTIALPQGTVTVGAGAFERTGALYYVLPEGCTAIESRAFADCPAALLILIPDSVTEIADDAFAGTDIAIRCSTGSEASSFAWRKGIKVVYTQP